MLSPSLATLRLFLHVLSASVWVGGQIALAGVVPTVRKLSPEATKAVARAFARTAWPAFAVAVLTGLDHRGVWAIDLPYGALMNLRIWPGEAPTGQIVGLQTEWPA